MSFASKFAAGMQIADDLMETYDTASMGAAMKEAKDAKPETTQEFSTEDAGKIGSAAQGGQDVTWSEQTGGYLAQPKEGGPPEIFQPKEHTSFLGQKSIGKMSDDQVVQARTGHLESKAAGLFNPARGLKMLNEFKTAEREDFKWGLLKTKAAQEAEAFKKEEAASAAEQVAWASTPSGQGVAKYAADMDAWQKDKEKREAAVKAGQPVEGPELPQPTMPAASPVQTMADTLRAMSARAGAGGKVDVASLAKMSLALDTATKEGYTAALRAGQEGMPIEQVAKLFNASGAARFDAASVTSDEVVKRPDGTTTRIIKYTDPATGKTQTIDTMATLGGLGRANEYYKRLTDGLKAQEQRTLNQSIIARNNAQAGLAGARATGGATGTGRSGAGGKAPKTGFDVAVDYLDKFNGKDDPTLRIAAINLARTAFELNPSAPPEEVANAAQMAASSPGDVKPRLDFASGRVVMAYVDPATGQKVALYGAPGNYKPTPDDAASFRADVTSFLKAEEQKLPGMEILLIGAATENNGGRGALQNHFAGQMQQDWMNAWQRDFAAKNKSSPTRLEREQALKRTAEKAAQAAVEHMRRYDNVLSLIKQYGAPRSSRP